MTAENMLGQPVAQAVKDDLRRRVAALAERGVVPGLGTVLVGADPGSHAYVRGKHRDCAEVGIGSIKVEYPADVDASELAERLVALNEDPACTGYLVQIPLPEHLDENAVLEQVDPDKDADGLHPVNLGRLVLGTPAPLPCTPRGIIALLRAHDVELNGATVCVVGRGPTVGRPMGLLLTRRTENSTVTLCHTGTRDLAAHTRTADVVIAAAGVPNLIRADMIAEGAVLVAVGITRTADGLVGDFHPSVLERASRIAPVPGGVGPLTRAMLLSNVVERAEAVARTAG